MQVEIAPYALDRVPISLLVDDGAPLINTNYFLYRDRNALLGQSRRYEDMPVLIPESFVREWAEWCHANGVKGKFSVIPCPAGLGRIDKSLPLISHNQLESWLCMCREKITPNFDITPEILTHTHIVDLETFQPIDAAAWEQYTWKRLPEEQEDYITEYVRVACQILANVGLPPQGVTSPGAFGSENLSFYARVVGNAVRSVTNNSAPFFFQRAEYDPPIPIPVWYADQSAGTAVGEIVASVPDNTGSWTGYDPVSVDKYITADLQEGCIPAMLNAGSPCILLSHWQGFYGMHNKDRRGFRTLKTVVERLSQRDPYGEHILWQKISEITNYACAREMASITVTENEVHMKLPLPVANFTLRITEVNPSTILVNRQPLTPVTSKRDFCSGTFYSDGKQTFVSFDPTRGVNTMTIIDKTQVVDHAVSA